MTMPIAFTPNPQLDLVLERFVDVPVQLVWEAWTKPEHVKDWFTPRPWTVAACEIDLRVGGKFFTTMRSPDGQEFPNEGCYLEIVPNERLVFTDTMQRDFRPSANPFMTAIIMMRPEGTGTHYTAIAMHKDEESRKKHEDMGFVNGWGAALDQLVALMKSR